MSLEATLLMLCEQQENILKCVQSWQTGQPYSIGEYLARLDDKVDLLLTPNAFSRGAGRGEDRGSAEYPFGPRHSDSSMASGEPGEPFQRRASQQSFSRTPMAPSFNLPHSVDEYVAEGVDEAKAHCNVQQRYGSRRRWSRHQTGTKTLSNYITEKKRRDLMAKLPMLVRITQSAYFELVCSAVIILNVLSISWQTQTTASRVEDAFVSGASYSDSVPTFFVAAQALFTAFFMLEMAMRWAAAGFIEFFSDGDRLWNWFDVLTVSAGVMQQLLHHFQVELALGSIYAVRCLRILRLLRVFRTLRFFVLFRELRMLIGICIGGLRAYVWCCCINFLLVLVFGITLTTRTYTHILTSEQYADDEGARLLQGSFGTLDKSMVSLFQAATGGRDWYEFYDLLRMVGAVDCLLLLVFLSLSIYVLANAASAIFVEGAMNHAKHDTELVIKQQLERGSESRKKLLNVFEEMDLDDNGTLTLEEFTSHLEDDRVVAYFEAFQLDVSHAPEIFGLLDVDGSGRVDIQEFIDGCISLKGEARHLELCLIQNQILSIGQNLDKIQRTIEKCPAPSSPSAVSMKDDHQSPLSRLTRSGFDTPKQLGEGLEPGAATGRTMGRR